MRVAGRRVLHESVVWIDVDLDGDLDLIRSTYGNALNGTAPTRIFLNDGVGAACPCSNTGSPGHG